MNQRGWVVLAVGLVALLGAAWWFSFRSVEEVHTAPAGPQVNAPTARTSPAPTAANDPPVRDEPRAAPFPAANPAAPAPSFEPDGKAIPRNAVDSQQLEQENTLISSARASVRSDPEGALRSIMEHRQKFPDGALAPEAELLQVEAYLRLGRKDEAEVLGRKLVAKEPPLKKKIDRLLERVRPN